MTEQLSKFLSEHRASEFGLAPVSKAHAIKMAENLESESNALLAVANWAEDAPHKYSTCTSASGKPLKCLCGKDDALAALPENLK